MKPTKRKLSDIDFSHEGSHIALCHKEQGAANMQEFALVLKASNFSDEFLEKAAQVRVTMEFDEFLTRFFGMYYEDAEVLSRVLGFSDESEDNTEVSTYEDYIQSKVESFEILKSIAKSEKLADSLSKLTEDQYLSILKDQSLIEKAFIQLDKQAKTTKTKQKLVAKKSSDVEKSTTAVPQIASGENVGAKPVVKLKSKETMTQDTKIVEQTVEVEMIEKSQFEAIAKQAAETQELLKSAMRELEVFKAEKAEMIAKARKQAVEDAVKAKDKAEVLFKSIEGLSDEAFNAVVQVVKSLSEQVEKSDLFKETGATGEVVSNTEADSAVAKILKSKFAK